MGGGGRGEASGFYEPRILDKIGDGLWIVNFQPTGLWISNGERIVDWVLFLRWIKDFVSENNGFWIHKLCVNLTFIVKWRSFP